MSDTVNIVLADDHAVLRIGLKAFLEDRTDLSIKVVGEAPSGTHAIELVKELHPDLLILDMSMPEMGGLETSLEIRRQGLAVKILILTQYNESIYLKRLLEAGVNGFILKSARGEELVFAIRSVMCGGIYIDPSMTAAILPHSHHPSENSSFRSCDEELYAKLTPREQQILKLTAEGLSNKEMANQLDLAVKTVMAHRSNLMEKLGIKNRSKLIKFSIRVGILTLEK